MVTVFILMVLVEIALVLILLGVVVVGIRQEPPWTELSEVAPSPIAAMIQRLLGLYVRRPTPAAVSTKRQGKSSPVTPATRTRATT
jgi:hypothetical protein